jgi:hypothetical protein
VSIAVQAHSGRVARIVRIENTFTKQTRNTVGIVIQPLTVLVVLTALLKNIFTALDENAFIVGHRESEVVVHTVLIGSITDSDTESGSQGSCKKESHKNNPVGYTLEGKRSLWASASLIMCFVLRNL